MAQDNLRAAVYRSLNKNDAVDCGTIGQSETSPSIEVEPLVHVRRGRQGLDPVPFNGVEEEEAMGLKGDRELQLLQISRGAHKLTQMIESWSRVPSLHGRSRDITRDLLQGALDLQESLIMLDRLQEASNLMSAKKKQKPEFLEERGGYVEEIGVEEMGPRRYADTGYNNGLQKPRLSLDGSSRNCVGELKKVIKDHFRRQNLLSVSSDDEKSSSSRSLRFTKNIRFMDVSCEHNERREASISSVMQCKKMRTPNLIAKLMGLEDIPSENVQPMRKQEMKNKSSKPPPRPTFDIKMPRQTNAHMIEQHPDPKRKTLEEIIQTMQFKGLLKSDYPRIQSRNSDTLPLEHYGRDFAKDDEAPPIVIMKPLHLPILERGEAHKDLHLDKIPVQENIHLVKMMQEKRQSVRLVQKKSVQLVQEEKLLDHGKMLPKKLERKELKSVEKTKSELSQKVTESKLSQKVMSSDFVFQKTEGKAIKTRKKSDVGTKPLVNGGRIEKKKDVKAIKTPMSQAKTSAMLARHDKKVSAAKNNVSSHTSSLRNSSQSSSMKPQSQNSTSLTKERKTIGAKSVRKSAKAINADKKSKEDAKDNDLSCELDNVSTEKRILPIEGLPRRADQCPKPCLEDDTREDQKIFSEVMPKINFCGKNPGLAEEAIATQDHELKTTICKGPGLEVDLKQLILSSQPFLSQAQELLNLGSQQPLYSQTKGIDKLVSEDDRLFLDCAKEIMARKIYQQELLSYPMLRAQIWVPTLCKSLDHLVEEIGNDIEKFIGYSVDEENVNLKDRLYIRLGKDLRCKDMLTNAVWDIGWGTWISMEEADQVVGAVEELILSWFIEEVVMELV